MSGRRLISLPFFLLRTGTAGAAFVTGLAQTFVFAHVLSPQRFSIFILVGAIGYTLWLCDLGIVKILFVRLRAAFLAKESMDEPARHATAVIGFYGLLTVAGALVCYGLSQVSLGASPREALEFSLFFWFITMNLVWFALRNVAIAVDEYVLFEVLETVRRGGYFAGLAALLAGLPLLVMLVAVNVLWIVVVAICLQRLVARGAVSPRLRGLAGGLFAFFRTNITEVRRSGLYAATEIYTSYFPYFLVPALFGLGAPPIILDTTFKVFKGGATVFGAVTDILVPRQTAALAERDGPTLVRATLLAAGLCLVPAAIASLILIFGADILFRLLLGDAATMPPAMMPILIALILANVTQMVCHSVLVHNGYFKDVARIGLFVVAGVTAAGVWAAAVHTDVVHFLAAYAAVYALGALTAVLVMIRGPIRHAYAGAAVKAVAAT